MDKLIAEQTKANKRLTVLKRIIKKLYEVLPPTFWIRKATILC